MKTVVSSLRIRRRVWLSGLCAVVLLAGMTLPLSGEILRYRKAKAEREWLAAWGAANGEERATLANQLPDSALLRLIAGLRYPANPLAEFSARHRSMIPSRIRHWLPDHHRSESFRFLAMLRALESRLDRADIQRALLEVAADSKIRNRHLAILMLYRARSLDEQGTGSFEKLAKDPNPKIRRAVFLVVGGRGSGQFPKMVTALAADLDPSVRSAWAHGCESDTLDLDQ